MAQLTNRVRQVECLKAEKAITNKYHKKEKVAYIDIYNYVSDVSDDFFEEGKVNVD